MKDFHRETTTYQTREKDPYQNHIWDVYTFIGMNINVRLPYPDSFCPNYFLLKYGSTWTYAQNFVVFFYALLTDNYMFSVCPGAELIIKYTDDTGEEVQWVQGADSSDMPHLYRGGSLAGKVDLAEVEHALDQDVQIPDKFREMLPVTEDKEEEENNKRIVLRIKKVKS